MANNRLYLKDKKTGSRILLCEYYPNTGWYFFHDQEKLDDWLDKTVNDDCSMFGRTDLELEYEDCVDKRNVLTIVQKTFEETIRDGGK